MMMKNRLKIATLGILSFSFAGLMLSSCFDDPEFPDEPRITFESLRYVSQDVSGAPVDSLILTIGFEDGDGDLGLDPDEDSAPYNPRHYFSNKTGTFLNRQTESPADVMVLSNRAEIDTLPEFNPDGDACVFWVVRPSDLQVVDASGETAPLDDTVYYQLNERHNNIYVRFFTDGANDQPEDGEIDEATEEINFRTINLPRCDPGYDGRFPILSDDLNESSALEGTIRYSMVQVGPFSEEIFFGNRLTKLRIYILDRAGNRSNIIETEPFRLSDIN